MFTDTKKLNKLLLLPKACLLVNLCTVERMLLLLLVTLHFMALKKIFYILFCEYEHYIIAHIDIKIIAMAII